MTEDEFQQLLDSITHKRAKIVIDHIRKHGFVTSEELTNLYGYSHPPRAVRDVRERGVPIVTYKVKGADGKNIAAYKFGDPSKVQLIGQKSSGRSALGNALKEALQEKGISTLIHYPIPPHQQACYKEWNHLSLPITERIHQCELSLPCHQAMTDAEVARVVKHLNSFNPFSK